MECLDFDKLVNITQNVKFSNAFYEIEQSVAELSDNIHRIQYNRENNLKRLTEMKKQVEEAIKQTRITINKHLEKIQDDRMTKLNATEEQEKKKTIIELLDLLKEKESEIIEYQKNIENIKKHATDIQTFISMKELEKNVSSNDEFLQSVIDSGNFKDRELSYNTNAAMQDLANRIKNFGEVKIETKPCDVVLTRRKDKQAQIMLPHIVSKSVAEVNLKQLKTIKTRENSTYGCCMLPDGKMAFTDHVKNTVNLLFVTLQHLVTKFTIEIPNETP
ncbi:unnamed protein product [Mytilus coruscus]|uniref:Uncharacterized protein n=1 Tax=Mytilus coruscus TaxID=42192 RepID=A0A6J8BXE7_MYTCO|nr:unnamed protein product [Mytilus coruscus]